MITFKDCCENIEGFKRVYETMTDKETPVDFVNHPTHYTYGNFETIEVIEDWNLGFCLGNALKYICRAGKKNPSTEAQDLKKAVWYLQRRIKQIEGGV